MVHTNITHFEQDKLGECVIFSFLLSEITVQRVHFSLYKQIQTRRHAPPPPPWFFFCLSALQSVMSMLIIPLPHYDNFLGENLKSKKVSVSPPPPPPRDFFCACAAVARYFALPNQTPWRRPWTNHLSTNHETELPLISFLHDNLWLGCVLPLILLNCLQKIFY